MPERRIPRHAWALVGALALAGCAGSSGVIDRPSPNQDDRVRFLVLHFTDENFARSLAILTDGSTERRVSAHYLVSAPGDPAAAPRVYRLVPEARRAWHAGESQWQGRHALNDQSVGIEITYESHCPRPGDGKPGTPAGAPPVDEEAGCAYGDYPPAQMEVVTRLSRAILARHPDIDPTRVVGHSDIAPSRKPDPGPRFPWHALYEAGVGAWYDEADVARYMTRLSGADAPLLPLLQDALAAYGYGIATRGTLDVETRDVLYAFQTHFLPEHRSGAVDARTTATALALLARYQPKSLQQLATKYGFEIAP